MERIGQHRRRHHEERLGINCRGQTWRILQMLQSNGASTASTHQDGLDAGKSSIQTDNSTEDGVANNTIVPKRLKSMGIRLHWLQGRDAQGQFRFFWAPGTNNWADYYTKHFSPIHHKIQRPIFSGILPEE